MRDQSRLETERTAGNEPAVVRSFGDVADLLAFVAVQPATRDLPVRVHGYYLAFRPGRGGVQFGVLLARPEQVEDVERVGCIPARIDFGVNIAIPRKGRVGVSQIPALPPDRSWVTLSGLLSWWDTPHGPPVCHLYVTGAA